MAMRLVAHEAWTSVRLLPGRVGSGILAGCGIRTHSHCSRNMVSFAGIFPSPPRGSLSSLHDTSSTRVSENSAHTDSDLFGRCEVGGAAASARPLFQARYLSHARGTLCGGSLAQAAKDGDIDLMTRLLEEGAQVDALDENKRTPLILACMSNHNHVRDPVSCQSSTHDQRHRTFHQAAQEKPKTKQSTRFLML